MRFERLALRGFGPFRDEVAVDLASLPGTLVAIVGSNGSGKTTACELMLGGALFRSCPTRGSLSDLATSRDSYVEVTVQNGARYTVRQTVDGVSKKGETLILDADGQPVLASGKVREADQWIAEHFPAQDVLYSSIFAHQASGGFLELGAAARKSVILEILGISKLERLAEAARVRARDARQALEVVRARIEDERTRSGDVAEARAAVASARQHAVGADAALADARAVLERLKAEVAQALDLQRAAAEARAFRARLVAELETARARVKDLDERIANNQRLLSDADAIRAAATRVTLLREHLAALEAERGPLADAEGAALRERGAHGAACQRALARAQEADRRVERARSQLRDRERIAEAVERVDALRAELDAAEAAVLETETERERLTSLASTCSVLRIVGLTTALRTIAAGETERAPEIAERAIDADEKLACEGTDAPEELQRLKAALEVKRQKSAGLRAEVADVERLAARVAEMRAADEALASAVATKAEAQAEAEREHTAATEAAGRAQAAASKRDLVATDIEAAKRELGTLTSRAALADRVAQADAMIQDRRAQREQALADVTRLETELAALPEPAAAPAAPDIRPAELRAHAADVEARAAASAVAVSEARLAAATAAQERVAGMEADRRRLDDDLADWTRLAEDLGKDGIQALEVDAAGPELTELVNDLLRTCVGSRWTVSIEATRTSADGKRQLEGCEVRVLDTERGREGAAESLSGGERTIIAEAISLALSMLACRRAGVHGPTLVRDESSAALDPVNGRAYIAMLRRAAEIVGASKILYVTHQVELQELADARIVVADGKVEVAA